MATMVEVLTGSNQHAIHDYLHARIESFTKEHGDSIERFDAAELTSIDNILDAVRSISLLDPKKLVIVVDPGASKELLEKIEVIIEQTADSTELMLAGQIDKRSKAYKFLQNNCSFKVFNDLSPAELMSWIRDYVAEGEGKIQSSVASYLVEQIGPDQYRLKNELDKLLLLQKPIDKSAIDQLVEPVPQSKVFNLLDAMFRGDAQTAWNMYKDQRMQGEEPYKIMAMITWQLQQLVLAVFAPQKTKDTLVKAGASPYTAQKSLQLAKTITPNTLRYYIEQLAEIDYQSKTSASIESALAVYISDVAVKQSTSP